MGVHLLPRLLRVLAWGSIVLVVLCTALAVTVAYTGASLPEAEVWMRSNSRVRVETGTWLRFIPEPRGPGMPGLGPPGSPTGFILYPGGFVDPRAYAPVAHAIAEAGHPVVIVPVRLRLAFFDIDAGRPVPAAYPEVQRWAVGGHSLGGVAAAWYAHGHSEQVAGLILWASYTDSAHSLAASSLPVVSISASRDGTINPARIAASRLDLPPTTRYVSIAGGNHAQFGAYRFQAGDQSATIGQVAQWREISDATIAFLDAIGAP